MTATTKESKGKLLKEWIATHFLFALGNTEVAILKPLGTEALNNIGGCRALKYGTKKLAQKNLSVILQEILQAVNPLYWWSPEGFRNNPVIWLTLQTQPLNFITWWNRAVLICVETTRAILQNTRPLISISLNKNSNYCYIPRSSKPTDTCK